MHVQIYEQVIPITVNGTTDGFVTVAATNNLYPGTKVVLYSAGAGAFEGIITSYSDTGVVGLRRLPTDLFDTQKVSYGRSDVSAWTVAGSATIFIERQIVPVEHLHAPKLGI
jgi:hypothetical protein